METSNTAAVRRQFLRRLVALVAGVSLAGVSGCGKEEDQKTLPTGRPGKRPSPPDKKPK